MDRHNILLPLREADVKTIRGALKRRRFEFVDELLIYSSGKS